MNRYSARLDRIASEIEGLYPEIALAIDRISDRLDKIGAEEELLSFKISLEKNKDFDLLKIGFGAPAQNDKILRDTEKIINSLIEEKLRGGKLLKINGPASLPVAMHLAHKVGHIYETVACFDPKLNKYVVSITHGKDFNVGDLID